MAAFDWGIPTKPASPLANQPFVDDARHVWQWDDPSQAWIKPSCLEFRRVREQLLLTRSNSVGSGVFTPTSGTLGRQWDDIYNLSFYEVWSSAGSLLGRRAHMTKTELNVWMATIIPESAGQYSDNVIIHIYEVFDTRQSLARWTAWNGLFGSFRGRDCYYGERGAGRSFPTQGHRAGYANAFAAWHGSVQLELELFNYFYGSSAAISAEPRGCWTSARRSTHNIPPTSNGVIMQVPAGGAGYRYAWDWGASSWSIAAPGAWEIFTSGLTKQNPCHIHRETDTHILSYNEPRTTLKGAGALWNNSSIGIEGMLAFHIRNRADPNRVAFLVKPLGITKCGFTANGLSASAGHDVIASGVAQNHGGTETFLNLTEEGFVEERGGSDGFRITDLPGALHRLRTCRSSMRATAVSIDTVSIPREIRFYLRDKTTGIRSPVFDPRVLVTRRKSGMPISLMDRR